MKVRALLIAVLVFALAGPGCDFLPEDGPGGSPWFPEVNEPTITTQTVTLTRSPTLSQMGAWYCPRISGDLLTKQLCAATLGPVPADAELVFRFTLPLRVENPNDFPLPAVELLTALHLFPGEDRREVAAVCITFCEEGDLECLQQGPGTCSSDEPEILTLEDLADAALNYLSIYIASELAGQVPPELRVRLIPANGVATVSVTLDIAPEPLLELLISAIDQHLSEIIDEEGATIQIPYDIEGAVWFVVENFGRFGVNFGPYPGTWTL